MSEIKHYPKWVYHKTEPAFIVLSKDEHEKLAKGWAEAPFPIDKKYEPIVEEHAAHKDEADHEHHEKAKRKRSSK